MKNPYGQRNPLGLLIALAQQQLNNNTDQWTPEELITQRRVMEELTKTYKNMGGVSDAYLYNHRENHRDLYATSTVSCPGSLTSMDEAARTPHTT